MNYPFRNEFNSRKEDVELYYTLTQQIDIYNVYVRKDGSEFEVLGIDTGLLFKSGLMLMLYNIIESTVTNCLTQIHDEMIAKGLRFDDLSPQIKLMILKFFKASTVNSHGIIRMSELDIHDFLANYTPFAIEFSYFNNRSGFRLYSGNLDSKEISKIAGRYGIHFSEECKQIDRVMSLRNKLAHGEISFRESCRDISIQHLGDIKNKVLAYMENFCGCIEDFILSSKYKIIHHD